MQLEWQSATISKTLGTIGDEQESVRITRLASYVFMRETCSTRTNRQRLFNGRLAVDTRLDVLPRLATDVLLTRQLTNLPFQFQ